MPIKGLKTVKYCVFAWNLISVMSGTLVLVYFYSCIKHININVYGCVLHNLVITTEKTNILLRYLHQQLDKKVWSAINYI